MQPRHIRPATQLRKFRMKSIGWGAAVLALFVSATSLRAEPVKLWETTGFKGPESALPVPAEGFAYVSNIAGGVTDKNGSGFISTVVLDDGKSVEL